MSDPRTLQEFPNGACVDAAVFSLRPDYRAVVLAVDGLVPGPSDDASEVLELAPGLIHPIGNQWIRGDRP